MHAAATCLTQRDNHHPPGRGSGWRHWGIIGLSAVMVFVFLHILGPLGLESAPLKPMADFIEENDINANAYYYTEVDEFFEAERHMREHLGLIPGARH